MARNAPKTLAGVALDGESERTGGDGEMLPRASAPVSSAPNERSAVPIRSGSPEGGSARTDGTRSSGPSAAGAIAPSGPLNAATSACSVAEAGSRATASAARAGSARRATSAAQRGAAMTDPEIGRRWDDRLAQVSRSLSQHLADGAGTDRGQLDPEVPGDGQGEPLDLLGRARELRPELGSLVAIPVGQVSEVALPGHVATERHERRRPEPELLGAEERRDQQVPTGPQPAIGPQDDPVAEAVPEQGLVDLGKTELPGRADVLDRAERACPGPAGVPGQVDVVGTGLDHSGGDRPDPRPATSFTPIRAAGLIRPEIGDELGKILDRVDVVMRRRADEGQTRLGAPKDGNLRGRLLHQQLAALAGFRPFGRS